MQVVCDASNFEVGGFLEKCVENGKQHPVEYYWKQLSPSERNNSATDCAYFHDLLVFGTLATLFSKFFILTNNGALTYIQSSASVLLRNTRWLEFLNQFDFTIKDIKGKENVVADALQRVPHSESILYNLNFMLGVQHVDNVDDNV